MTCADDLTVDDLNGAVSTSVLERVSAGAGSNSNLWPQIDRDKWASNLPSRCVDLTDSVTGVNLVDPASAPVVIKTWDDRLTETGIESGVDDEASHPPHFATFITHTLHTSISHQSLTRMDIDGTDHITYPIYPITPTPNPPSPPSTSISSTPTHPPSSLR